MINGNIYITLKYTYYAVEVDNTEICHCLSTTIVSC